MLIEQHRAPVHKAVTLAPGGPFDLELILPLSLIRTHTKTEDIPAVTDEQLALYRRAALEAAEKYTGTLFTEQKNITEVVVMPTYRMNMFRGPTHFQHTTKAAFAQPMAYLYGHKNGYPQQIPVVVGSRTVRLPIITDEWGFGCCNPCAEQVQPRLLYLAGYDCESNIPAALALGALKYIAHVIENPGDMVVATSESGGPRSGITVDQSGNPALASGAIEVWRVLLDFAI